jgi:hypothetical protein
MHSETYRRWIYTTIQEKNIYKHRPSEAWLPNSGLLKIKLKRVHNNFPCRPCAKDKLLGPYCLPPCLTGVADYHFLPNFLPQLFQSVDLRTTRIYLWITHNGAPVYFLLAVREFLNQVFMEQGASRAWPAPSDLNPFDFYFWVNLKSAVYAREVSNIRQDLQQWIQNRFGMICTTLGILQQVRKSITVQTCNKLHWSWWWTLQETGTQKPDSQVVCP